MSDSGVGVTVSHLYGIWMFEDELINLDASTVFPRNRNEQVQLFTVNNLIK